MDRYFLEVWIRDSVKDALKEKSSEQENFHPHITLVRPFSIKIKEDLLKEKICEFCSKEKTIKFKLKGKGEFGKEIFFIPVTKENPLLTFSEKLEKLIEKDVIFVPKLEDKKILHATIKKPQNKEDFPEIEQVMLRLTGIKNKKIWFSYDFVTKEILNREKSLDKNKWNETVNQFSKEI